MLYDRLNFRSRLNFHRRLDFHSRLNFHSKLNFHSSHIKKCDTFLLDFKKNFIFGKKDSQFFLVYGKVYSKITIISLLFHVRGNWSFPRGSISTAVESEPAVSKEIPPLFIKKIKLCKVIFPLLCTYVQGNSEKCTGAFKFGYRVIFYSSKSCRKSGLISHLSIEFTQKKIHIMF